MPSYQFIASQAGLERYLEEIESATWIAYDTEFISEGVKPLIKAELDVLGKMQKEDGGFDISWQWYTPYAEFEQARIWWRPRVTLEKLLFVRAAECCR